MAGYWSDNTANVELAILIRNEGEGRLDRAIPIAITCSQSDEVLKGCSYETTLTVPDGHEQVQELITLRVPVGDVSLVLAYGEDQTQILDFNVPERILGVDREVWECFSDKSKVGTIWEEDEGIGCSGWEKEFVQKWDQTSPVTVSVNGPDGFVNEFKNVLNHLSHVVNLQFEWVDVGTEANIEAHIGLTDAELSPQGVFCVNYEDFGCANTVTEAQSGRVKSGEIIVYNLWPDRGNDLGDFDQWFKDLFKAAMIHEAVHALGRMEHRTELLSVMNAGLHHRAELSPMDEALLKLHGHLLVEPGMTLEEIQAMIVFNDELMDPQPLDPRLLAWKLVSGAYEKLREVTTANFTVRSSFPGCSEELGWAEYEVANLLNSIRISAGWV